MYLTVRPYVRRIEQEEFCPAPDYRWTFLKWFSEIVDLWYIALFIFLCLVIFSNVSAEIVFAVYKTDNRLHLYHNTPVNGYM